MTLLQVCDFLSFSNHFASSSPEMTDRNISEPHQPNQCETTNLSTKLSQANFGMWPCGIQFDLTTWCVLQCRQVVKLQTPNSKSLSLFQKKIFCFINHGFNRNHWTKLSTLTNYQCIMALWCVRREGPAYIELLRVKRGDDCENAHVEIEWRGRIVPSVASKVNTKGRRQWNRLPREDAGMFRNLKDPHLHSGVVKLFKV